MITFFLLFFNLILIATGREIFLDITNLAVSFTDTAIKGEVVSFNNVPKKAEHPDKRAKLTVTGGSIQGLSIFFCVDTVSIGSGQIAAADIAIPIDVYITGATVLRVEDAGSASITLSGILPKDSTLTIRNNKGDQAFISIADMTALDNSVIIISENKISGCPAIINQMEGVTLSKGARFLFKKNIITYNGDGEFTNVINIAQLTVDEKSSLVAEENDIIGTNDNVKLIGGDNEDSTGNVALIKNKRNGVVNDNVKDPNFKENILMTTETTTTPTTTTETTATETTATETTATETINTTKITKEITTTSSANTTTTPSPVLIPLITLSASESSASDLANGRTTVALTIPPEAVSLFQWIRLSPADRRGDVVDVNTTFPADGIPVVPPLFKHPLLTDPATCRATSAPTIECHVRWPGREDITVEVLVNNTQLNGPPGWAGHRGYVSIGNFTVKAVSEKTSERHESTYKVVGAVGLVGCGVMLFALLVAGPWVEFQALLLFLHSACTDGTKIARYAMYLISPFSEILDCGECGIVCNLLIILFVAAIQMAINVCRIRRNESNEPQHPRSFMLNVFPSSLLSLGTFLYPGVAYWTFCLILSFGGVANTENKRSDNRAFTVFSIVLGVVWIVLLPAVLLVCRSCFFPRNLSWFRYVTVYHDDIGEDFKRFVSYEGRSAELVQENADAAASESHRIDRPLHRFFLPCGFYAPRVYNRFGQTYYPPGRRMAVIHPHLFVLAIALLVALRCGYGTHVCTATSALVCLCFIGWALFVAILRPFRTPFTNVMTVVALVLFLLVGIVAAAKGEVGAQVFLLVLAFIALCVRSVHFVVVWLWERRRLFNVDRSLAIKADALQRKAAKVVPDGNEKVQIPQTHIPQTEDTNNTNMIFNRLDNEHKEETERSESHPMKEETERSESHPMKENLDRKTVLHKIKEWKHQFMDTHGGVKPKASDFEADPEIAPVFALFIEYKQQEEQL